MDGHPAADCPEYGHILFYVVKDHSHHTMNVNGLSSCLSHHSINHFEKTASFLEKGYTHSTNRCTNLSTNLSPSFVNATTLEVVHEPSDDGIMTGEPPSITDTQLFVVPKSMSIALLTSYFFISVSFSLSICSKTYRINIHSETLFLT